MADEFKIDILSVDKRLVSGWASVETVDRQGQYVPVNELIKAMLEYMDRGGLIFYGHENKPIGQVLFWDVREHPETGKPGVYIIAKINRGYKLDDIVWKGIKTGKLRGFSIAGMGNLEKQIMKGDDGKEREVEVLKDIELTEISIVETPANQYAIIEEINYFAKGMNSYVEELKDASGDEYYKKLTDTIVDRVVKALGDKLDDVDVVRIMKEVGMFMKSIARLGGGRMPEIIAVFEKELDAKIFADENGYVVVPTEDGRWIVMKADEEEKREEEKKPEEEEKEEEEKPKRDIEGVEGLDMEIGKEEGAVSTEAGEAYANPVYGDKVTREKEKVDEEDKEDEEEKEEEIEKADAPTKAELISLMKKELEKYVETTAQKQEIPSLVEWIWVNYVEAPDRPKPVGEILQEINDRLEIGANNARKFWDKVKEKLKKVREQRKNEQKKGIGQDGYRIYENDSVIGIEISKEYLVEFAKPEDVRPPKEWLERKVKELQEEQGLDKESATRLAAWIYWHWMKPTKPEGKKEPDKPDTREARQRKRKWLSKADEEFVKEMLQKSSAIRQKIEIAKKKKRKSSDKTKQCMNRYKDPNQKNRFKVMTCPDDASQENRFCGCVRAMMNCKGMSLERAKRFCGYLRWYVKKGEIKKKIDVAKADLK